MKSYLIVTIVIYIMSFVLSFLQWKNNDYNSEGEIIFAMLMTSSLSSWGIALLLNIW